MKHNALRIASIGVLLALLGSRQAVSGGERREDIPSVTCDTRGDRQPAVNCVYPEAAFWHAGRGGRLIDVTKPPFSAKGDGTTDDTGALIAAINFVTRSRVPVFTFRNYREGSFILYLPNGTYLVSDTVACSLPVLVGAPPYDNYVQHWVMTDEELSNQKVFPVGRYSNEQNDSVIILGQSREGTVLRLRDNCPGFGAGQCKAVLSCSRLKCGSNVNLNNVLENLTIDTGRGNPGAAGLRWNASNAGVLRNMTVRSADGAGLAGFLCDVRNVQGLVEDVTVVGFDEGLSLTAGAATVVTLEHATFTNQRSVAVRLANCSRIAARDVVTGSVPTALRVESCSHAVVMDSNFRGSPEASSAIELVDGHLFARDITAAGYKCAVSSNGHVVVEPPAVDEYVSSAVLSTETGDPARSLHLPVENSPRLLHEANVSNWASVDEFGAVGDGVVDDTGAIQRAMDSGRPAVLFPKVAYAIHGTVAVPRTVRQISFLYGCALRAVATDQAMFRVAEDSPDPLWFQQCITVGGLLLDHSARRTVVLEDAVCFFPFIFGHPSAPQMFPWKVALPDFRSNNWRLYRNASPEGPPKRVFVNNAVGFAAGGAEGKDAVENVAAWCRQVNTEHYEIDFAFRRSDVWMLGFKSEIDGTHFQASDGTRMEVLGGLYYQGGPNRPPVVVAEDSRVCLTMTACAGENPSETILKDTKNGSTRVIELNACPPMHPQVKTMPLIPLLVNYSSQ
jgi:hypothetical protein